MFNIHVVGLLSSNSLVLLVLMIFRVDIITQCSVINDSCNFFCITFSFHISPGQICSDDEIQIIFFLL